MAKRSQLDRAIESMQKRIEEKRQQQHNEITALEVALSEMRAELNRGATRKRKPKEQPKQEFAASTR